ncbi:hypothetical protein TrVGV298_011634 [Trichoderma virens]|nr:hypothetical protein TrVGV298_011634 [Trichoderma virens]
MKPTTAIIFLHASAASDSLLDTILPANPPTITSEAWQCTTEMLPQYFDPPKPTGALLTAILSYGDEIQKGCKPTETDIYGLPECTFPPVIGLVRLFHRCSLVSRVDIFSLWQCGVVMVVRT